MLPVCQKICLRVSSLISNYVFLLSVLRLSFKYCVFHQGNVPFFERTCRNAIEETACDPPLLIHLPLDQKQLFITICVLFPQLNQPNATFSNSLLSTACHGGVTRLTPDFSLRPILKTMKNCFGFY